MRQSLETSSDLSLECIGYERAGADKLENEMKALKVIGGLLSVFISLPISFYLQYQILQRVNASELMWFLFLANLPVVVFVQSVMKIAEKSDD